MSCFSSGPRFFIKVNVHVHVLFFSLDNRAQISESDSKGVLLKDLDLKSTGVYR